MNEIKWSDLPVDDYEEGYSEGGVMTIEEFGKCIVHNTITDDDGVGYWATADKVSDWNVFVMWRPTWATHVAWYSK